MSGKVWPSLRVENREEDLESLGQRAEGRGQGRIPWGKAGRCVKEKRSLDKVGVREDCCSPFEIQDPLRLPLRQK